MVNPRGGSGSDAWSGVKVLHHTLTPTREQLRSHALRTTLRECKETKSDSVAKVFQTPPTAIDGRPRLISERPCVLSSWRTSIHCNDKQTDAFEAPPHPIKQPEPNSPKSR